MNQDISFNKKNQLLAVKLWINWLNFWLNFFRTLLFRKLKSASKNILIYKIGNIGDIVCAVPAIIAIRKNFPEAKIALLTSPGKIEASGAKELLEKAWYVDELKVYYGADIDSWQKKKKLVGDLKKNRYDLFIQLPDDLANFRTLFRNMIFAKLIGVKSAFGFKIRTIQLFKKTQVDYTTQKTEVESLLDLLKENSIKVGEAEFDFNISDEHKNKVKKLLEEKWDRIDKKEIIVVISPGGKRETNQWPIERFAGIAEYLQEKYGAKILIVGGPGDIPKAEIMKKGLNNSGVLVTVGKLELLETLELLKYCSFLIANSTGTMHLAAAVGMPAVCLFTTRDVFGRWFPYGKNHKILYHKFTDCNYKKEECIKKSIEMISVEEVISACDKLIKKYE